MNQVNSGIRINWTVLWTDQSKGYNNFKDGNGLKPFFTNQSIISQIIWRQKKESFCVGQKNFIIVGTQKIDLT